MKIIFIRKIWPHHTQKSGYDRVFREFAGSNFKHCYIRNRTGYGLMNFFIRKLFPRRKNICISLILVELKLLVTQFFFRADLMHFTYLYNEFFLFTFPFFRPKCQLVATIHHPPSFWKTHFRSWDNFKYLDKIIVLDKNSRDFFTKQLAGICKVEMIPHPVDTEYFRPDPSKRFNDGQLHIIFAGRFLRNTELLCELIHDLHLEQPNAFLHVVFPFGGEVSEQVYKYIHYFSYPNVKHYDYLSDEQLRDLYQSCHVLLQPLYDATANNVILEAKACGLPVVASRVGGVESYFDKRMDKLCSGKEEFKSALNYFDQKKDLELLAVIPQKFTLRSVQEELIDFYRNLISDFKKR